MVEGDRIGIDKFSNMSLLAMWKAVVASSGSDTALRVVTNLPIDDLSEYSRNYVRDLTFEYLDQYSNTLSKLLLKAGVLPGDRIGLHFHASDPGEIISLLAVLKCAAIYVALDNASCGRIVTDAGVRLVLVGGRESVGKSTIFLPNKTPLLRIGQWGEISEGDELIRQPLPDLEPPRSSLDGAFNILYTSGSSGPSKGVVGRERGFVYRIGWMHQAFPFIKDKELVLRRTPLAFVDSVWEIWGALLAGVPLCIHLTSLGMPDPAFLQCLGVTRATLTPSLLVNLLHCNAPILSRGQLRFCLCSGETLSFVTARALLMRVPLCTIIHLYGSTEVSGDASWTTLTTGDLEYGKNANLDIVPLGKPLPGTRLWLVGSERSTKLEVGQIGMPVDMNGELWVEGPGVALGYYGKHGIHSNFVAKERDGHPVFKTGDLVRCISDTTDTSLYFLHRRDSSAKLRGIWIHLEEGERELALALGLNSKEELGLTVVSSNTDTENSELLIALTWKAAQLWPNLPKLTQRLIGRGISPELMPTRIVVGMKDQLLPLTSNGKLDRQMLSTWGSDVVSRCTSYAEMVRSRFKDDSNGYWLEFCFSTLVGTQDENHIGLGLFQRGGHSLLAMQALYHIERHFKAASAGVMIEDMARPVAEISKKIGRNRDTLPRKRGSCFIAETISDINQLPTMLQAWTFEFEKCVDAQPCVVSLDNGERLIIVGAHDHNIAALEANTGKVKWRSQTSGRIEGKVAVQNDLIFVPCLDYRLYAFSLITGELAWTFITQGELKCTPLPLWLPRSIGDELEGISLVLFGSYDGRIYVVESSSGACFAKPFPLQGSPYASPIVIPGGKRNSDLEERIITVTNRGRVAQLKLEREGMVPKEAHLRWALHSDWEQEIGCAVFTTPVYTTTTAYLIFGGTDGAVVALDPFNGGSIVWRILLDHVQSSPIFISPCLMPRNSETEVDFVLIACQTSLYCIQTSSGKLCWKKKSGIGPDEVITGQPTFLEGSLIVLLTTQFGKLLLLNLDSELDAVDTGTRELILTGESRLTSPAIITLPEETVFPYRKSWQCSIGSRDNKVYMITISG